MFIRRTTYKLITEFNTNEGQQAFESEMRTLIRPEAINGLITTSHIPNDDGTWSVVAVWESESHAMSNTEAIWEVWNGFTSKLAAPPKIETGGATLMRDN